MTESINHETIRKKVEAFHPDFVKVDERSVQDLIQLFVSYAKQIPFVDEHGNTLGSWDEMYTRQMLYLWVRIYRLELNTLDQKKQFLLTSWNLDRAPEALIFLGTLLRILKELYVQALRVNAVWVIDEIIAVFRDNLVTNVKQLTDNCGKVTHNILKLWIAWTSEVGDFDAQEYHSTKKPIKDLFRKAANDALNCLFILQKKARSKEFTSVLYNGKNPAHIGLLFGFFKSYQYIQHKFNELPKRHIDFYYENILKQSPLAAEPDLVHLFITLMPGVTRANIAEGVPFLAGVDEDGNDIIYEAIRPFRLISAEITEIRTLLFNKNNTILPLRSAEMVTGVYMDSVPKPQINKILKEGNAWALFGEPQSYKDNKPLPDIGWAIGSPVFNLTDGLRTVALFFEVSKKGTKRFDAILDRLLESEPSLISESEKNAARIELCHRFFSTAFELHITAIDGWFFIDNYAAVISKAQNGVTLKKSNKNNYILKLEFTLTADIPAWISYNSEIHGPNYNSSLPLVTIKLKQDSAYYPYSLLEVMEMESLEIKAKVKNFNKLEVFNKHGMLDITNPFPILGMNPLLGNRCYIGAREWRQKELTNVECSIEWMDLPKPGFQNYYQEYETTKITDESFRITLGNNKSTAEEILLFNSSNGEIQEQTTFGSMTVNKLVNYGLSSEEEIFNPKNNPAAFIKIELVAPEAGFGSDIYLNEMALYGQRVIKARKKQIPFPPKKPYVPLARSITVTYETQQYIDFNSGASKFKNQPFDFFHIHPYGVVKEGDENKIESRNLLPKYDARGHLFIGLDKAKPLSLLSIFLKLVPSLEALRDDKKELDMQIDYLSGKTWESLSENTDENTTMWGQESGIIRLFFPDDLESDHPLFDKSKNWIRISVDSKYLGAIGRCIHINTNVIVVRRKLDATAITINALPPFSIEGSLFKNNQIQSIAQPFHSFGGRSKEAEAKFYARISNRLGHKNRLVRPRDYRRMILEKFSEVNWIEVLTASKYKGDFGMDCIDPGTVKLIVMPKIEMTTDRSSYNVPKYVQKKIEAYVRAHCAPGLIIEVESPDYEEVLVQCKLVRKDENLIIPYIDIANIIRRQIAPWLYFEKSSFKRVHTEFSVSSLIQEMSKHSNVAYVEYCQVIHVFKNKDGYQYFDSYTHGDIIAPTTGKSILIPAKGFNVYQTSDQETKGSRLAIGGMKVNETFIITNQR